MSHEVSRDLVKKSRDLVKKSRDRCTVAGQTNKQLQQITMNWSRNDNKPRNNISTLIIIILVISYLKIVNILLRPASTGSQFKTAQIVEDYDIPDYELSLSKSNTNSRQKYDKSIQTNVRQMRFDRLK